MSIFIRSQSEPILIGLKVLMFHVLIGKLPSSMQLFLKGSGLCFVCTVIEADLRIQFN